LSGIEAPGRLDGHGPCALSRKIAADEAIFMDTAMAAYRHCPEDAPALMIRSQLTKH
jgi:hypothetical protein